MTYKLDFDRRALKEWKMLGYPVREQFKKKLADRLENSHVPASCLSGRTNRYKIKLKPSDYRLMYEVCHDRIVLLLITVGKRSGDEVYDQANSR